MSLRVSPVNNFATSVSDNTITELFAPDDNFLGYFILKDSVAHFGNALAAKVRLFGNFCMVLI